MFSRNDEAPISQAEVFHHDSGIIKLSDENGKVVFSDLKEGLQFFSVFVEGYETLTDSIRIAGDSVNRKFLIEPLSYEVTALDIIAQRQEYFAIRQLNDIEGTSVYAGKKSEVVLVNMVKGNVASNNGREIYAQVAGLNIYEGSGGGLQLNLGGRGLDPNRTSNFNTRQNGYDISADVLGYPENYYTPPSEALSEIRIIRGASSLQYGTQFGGLIDFRIKKIPNFKNFQLNSTQTVSSFGSFNSFNSVGLRKGKASLNAFYNYRKGDGYRTNSAYEAHNIFVAVDYSLSEKTRVGAEFTYYNSLSKQAGGLTDQQFLNDPRQSTRDRNWFAVNWKLYNFNLQHDLSSTIKFELSLFGLDAARKAVGFRGNPVNLNENPITGLDEQTANGIYILPRDLIIGEFRNYGAEAKLLTEWGGSNPRKRWSGAFQKAILLVGVKYFKSDNTSMQGAGSLGIDADFDFYNATFSDYPNLSSFIFPNQNVAFFSENIFYLSDRLTITPGVRGEYIKTEARGTYRQVSFDNAGNPIDNTILRDDRKFDRKFVLFGLGVEYKKSEKLKLVVNISQNYRSVTFSDIRVVSPTSIVDPDIKDERGLTMDLGVKGRFARHLAYDLAVYSVLYDDRIGVILDSSANRVRKNIGSAVIAGTESLITINVLRWLRPERRELGLNVFLNSAFTFSEYLSSEENNVVGKQVEFIPTANLKLGLTLRYKQAALSYQYSYLSEQFTDVQNSDKAAIGDLREGIIGPIPSYSISDLSFTSRYKNLRFKAGINNLLNHSYFTRRATGYPGPGIIPSDGRSYYASVSYVIE